MRLGVAPVSPAVFTLIPANVAAAAMVSAGLLAAGVGRTLHIDSRQTISLQAITGKLGLPRLPHPVWMEYARKRLSEAPRDSADGPSIGYVLSPPPGRL